MKTTKLLPLVVCGIALVSCLLSCEKKEDFSIESEVSKEFIPEPTLNDHSPTNTTKISDDVLGLWRETTDNAKYFTQTGQIVNEVINGGSHPDGLTINNGVVHPDYQVLLDALDISDDVDHCESGCEDDEGSPTGFDENCLKICKIEEEEAIQEAEEAINEYIAAGLPLVLETEFNDFRVTRQGGSYLYIYEDDRDLEIALPVYNPGNNGQAWFFNNETNTWIPWIQLTYTDCVATGTDPKISCNSGTIGLLTGNSLPDLTSRITVADNCANYRLIISQSPQKGTRVKEGNQTITITVTGLDGKTNSCSIIVNGTCGTGDTTAPSMSCAITSTQNLTEGDKLPSYTGRFRATDDCTGVSITQSPSAGSTVREGNQTITITATDGNGNRKRCYFTVNGKECKIPSISSISATTTTLCFLSTHSITANGTRGDVYQWKVSQNANIVTSSTWISSNATYTSTTPYINIRTGNGEYNFNGEEKLSPPTNNVFVSVRSKDNECGRWSSWKFKSFQTVNFCN